MFRANRGRIIGIALTIFVVYFLFTSSTESDFRRRTEEGIARKHGVLRGDLSDEALTEQTNQKLQKILGDKEKKVGAEQGGIPVATASDAAKSKTNEFSDETSVAGRKTMTKPKDNSKPKYPLASNDGDDEQKTTGGPGVKDRPAGDPGKDYARERLQEYLKKPVVIFSKSYCPHSKRAKHLLQDLYTIVPPPLVVELDQLSDSIPSSPNDDPDAPPPTLGRKLQDLLGEISGRRTVPNIMVGMHSIGGNDLIWEMHEKGTLAEEIRRLAGKRVSLVEVKEGAEAGSLLA